MPFAQVVVGPPGSGKSTYCQGMQMLLQGLGRKVRIVNLDAANENLPYENCYFDAGQVIDFLQCMQINSLGPNGTTVKCMETLYEQRKEILEILTDDNPQDFYYLFDIPGQVELVTNYNYLSNMLHFLAQQGSFRFAVVNLIDSHFCNEPTKYLSGLILTLKTMLNFEFPFVNVMSKIDILNWSELEFGLEFYAAVEGLDRMPERLKDKRFGAKYAKLNEALCELIDDFGLIRYIPLAIEDKEMMLFLLHEVDKANGFAFATLAINESIIETRATIVSDYYKHLENIELQYNPTIKA